MALIKVFNHANNQLSKLKLNSIKAHVSQCLLCNGQCQTMPLICHYCLADLPYFHKQHNNLLLWPKVAQHVSHQHIDHLLCLAPYQWPFNVWLNQIKYQNKFELTELLAQLFLFQHRQSLLQLCTNNSVIINMPIHINRWQERGYNQSHLIVKHISKQLALNYQNNLVIRHKATEKQVGKTGVARRKNLKNAFRLNPDLVINTETLPEQVIIFDDVVTTGTTVNELAKLLKKAGVNHIIVIAIALAIEKI